MAGKNRQYFLHSAFVCLWVFFLSGWVAPSIFAAGDSCKPKLILTSDGGDGLAFGTNATRAGTIYLTEWRPNSGTISKILERITKRNFDVLFTEWVDKRNRIKTRRRSRWKSVPHRTPQQIEDGFRGDRTGWYQEEADRLRNLGVVLHGLVLRFDEVYRQEAGRLGGRLPDREMKRAAYEKAILILEESAEKMRNQHPDAIDLFDRLDSGRRNGDGVNLLLAALARQREVIEIEYQIEEALQRHLDDRFIADATPEDFEIAVRNSNFDSHITAMDPEREEMLDTVTDSIRQNARFLPPPLARFILGHEKYLSANGLPRTRPYYEFIYLVDIIYSMGFHTTI